MHALSFLRKPTFSGLFSSVHRNRTSRGRAAAGKLVLAERLEDRRLLTGTLTNELGGPITADPNPASYGKPVTLTEPFAAAPGFATPTGTCQFVYTAEGGFGPEPITVADGKVGGGIAQGIVSPPLAVGTYHLQIAFYSGDSNYAPFGWNDISPTYPLTITTAVHTKPTITGPGNQTAAQGVAQAINLGSFSDPDSGPWSATVNWGDSSANTTFTTSKAGSLGTQSHAYAAAGNHTVTVTVTNSANQSASGTFVVNATTAVHTKPTITGPGNQTAAQGIAQAINLGSFSDPDSGPWSATVNWGDSSASTTFTTSKVGSLGTQSHAYAAAGNHTVTVTVTNSANQSASDVFVVDATASPHTAPTVTAPNNQTALKGVSQAIALGSFSDPNSGPWTVAVNWGDGSSATGFNITAPGLLTQTHSFTAVGTLTVTVTVTNSAKQSTSASFHVVSSVGNPAPAVTALAPEWGLLTGGTTVTIKGNNLGTASTAKVYFGAVPATVVSDNGSTIVATSPAESSGTVDVRVMTASGESAITLYDEFIYAMAPHGVNSVGSSFIDPLTGKKAMHWYDPAIAVGYDYQVTSGPNFATVELPLGYTTTGYKLYLSNSSGVFQTTAYATVAGGVPFNLPTGVRKLRVLGISTSANLDPTNPLAFATGFEFASQTPVAFTMSPIKTPVLTGSATSPTVAQLNFTAVAGATGYLVQREVNGVWQSFTFGSSTILASNFTGCSITGLTAGTSLNFRVGAILPQQTIYSNTITIKQPGKTPAQVLTGSAISATVVQLQFTAVAGATGYLIQLEVNGVWQPYIFGGSTILPSSYAGDALVIEGLTPGTSLNFRIGAITPQGTVYSNTLTITLPYEAQVLTGSATSSTAVQLDFTAVAGATGYLVQREVNGVWQSYVFGTSTILATKYNGATISGLTPGASLTFRIGAITPKGTIYSNTLTITQPK